MERRTRSDKKIRVAPSLRSDTHDKLKKLALACGEMSKTALAGEIIELVLNTPESVNILQDMYGSKDNPYRVLPVKDGKKIVYKAKYAVGLVDSIK